MFLSTRRKRKPETPAFFKFLRFEERFQRALFSTQINVDGRPNRRDKAVFTNACTMKPQAVENIIQSIA